MQLIMTSYSYNLLPDKLIFGNKITLNYLSAQLLFNPKYFNSNLEAVY